MEILIIYISTVLISTGISLKTISNMLKDIGNNKYTINPFFYDQKELNAILDNLNLNTYKKTALLFPLINLLVAVDFHSAYKKNKNKLISQLVSIHALDQMTPREINEYKNNPKAKTIIDLAKRLEKAEIIKLQDGAIYFDLDAETKYPIVLKATGVYKKVSPKMQADILKLLLEIIAERVANDIKNYDNYMKESQIINDIQSGVITINKSIHDIIKPEEITPPEIIKSKTLVSPKIETHNKVKTRVRKIDK